MTKVQEHKELGPESRLGWNGTFVFEGEIVHIRKPGFGHHCRAKVLKLGNPGIPSVCEVQIVKAGKQCPLKVDNRLDLVAGWLEGIRM